MGTETSMRIEDFTKCVGVMEGIPDTTWTVDDALRFAISEARKGGIKKCTVLLYNDNEGEVHFIHAGMNELEMIGLSARHFVRAAVGELSDDDDE